MKTLCCFLIRVYQSLISPILPASCRYQPSCSEYMLEAIATHGTLKGIAMGGKRLLRCHPFAACGYDPVPLEKEKH